VTPLHATSDVALVGAGAMGRRIGQRLLATGHRVTVWNRTPSKTAPLLDAGAATARTPAEAAARAEVVITMLSDAAALDAVLSGREGLSRGLAGGMSLIDMTTGGTAMAQALPLRVPHGVGVLDAPVQGSLAEAETGTLRIFVGGATEVLERCRPVLESLGTPSHMGPAGAGAAAKLLANASLLGTVALLGEVVALADTLGLPRETTMDVLSVTPLGAQAAKRHAALENLPTATRFGLSLARKDLDLALEGAGYVDGLIAATRERFAAAEAGGLGSADYTAVLHAIVHRERRPAGD